MTPALAALERISELVRDLCYRHELAQWNLDLALIRDQLVAAERDAARYRWLRTFRQSIIAIKPDSFAGDTEFYDTALDEAIDAAQAKGAEG